MNINSPTVQQDVEPTPEFYARSLEVMNQWQKGELPFEQANAALSAMEQEAADGGHLANQGRIEQILGYMQSYRGNLNVSIHHYERARAFYTQVGNKLRIAICDLNIGEVYRYKGDFNRARALYEKSYEASQAIGDISNQAFALCNRGQMYLSMGQLANARADLEESLRLSHNLDDDERPSLQCEAHYAMTMLHLQNSHIDAAWAAAQTAHEIAYRTNDPLQRGFANRAIAEVLTVAGKTPGDGLPADPDSYFQSASESFREINVEGEIARTMFAHAKSLARRGRRMTAARKLQLAMIIFTRLGMVDDAAKAAEAQLEVL